MPLYDWKMVIAVFSLLFPDSFLGWKANLPRSASHRSKCGPWKFDLLVYCQFCSIMANLTAPYCNRCLPFHLFNCALIHQRHWRVMIFSRPVGRTSPSPHTSVNFKCHHRNAPKRHNLLFISSPTDADLVPNHYCTYQLLIQPFGLDVSF